MKNKQTFCGWIKYLSVLIFVALFNTQFVHAINDYGVSQEIFVTNNPVGVIDNTVKITVGYNTSDSNNQLSGLGFRVHFNSSQLKFNRSVNVNDYELIIESAGPFSDEDNYDNDENTDSYLTFAWASLFATWPNSALPTALFDAEFDVLESNSTVSNINFSRISSAAGYDFVASGYQMPLVRVSWDFDGNGELDALTDGLLFLRYAFDLTGADLTGGVIAHDSPLSHEEIEQSLVNAMAIADIGGDGNFDALTDGLILMRYLFDLRGEIFVQGILSDGATRVNHAEVQEYIELYMPSSSMNDDVTQIINIFAGEPDSNWAAWNCCGSISPKLVFDTGRGDVYQFEIGEGHTIVGFTTRPDVGGGGVPIDASMAENGIISFDMKVITPPNDLSSTWLMKIESSDNSTFAELPLINSQQGQEPEIGVWQTYTFSLEYLADIGLDISDIGVLFIFPAWATGEGAVFQVDTVRLELTGLRDTDETTEVFSVFDGSPNQNWAAWNCCASISPNLVFDAGRGDVYQFEIGAEPRLLALQ